jgi:hypothetical protein
MIIKQRGLVIGFVILVSYSLLAFLIEANAVVLILAVALATSLTLDLLGLLLFKGYFKNTILRNYLMGIKSSKVKNDSTSSIPDYEFDEPLPDPMNRDYYNYLEPEGLDVASAMSKILAEEIDKAAKKDKLEMILMGEPIRNSLDYEIALEYLKPFRVLNESDSLLPEEDYNKLNTLLKSVVDYTVENSSKISVE